MKILAALFIDDISMFENENGLTRLNLSGVQFTIAVSEPFPLTLAPHLVVLIHSDHESSGAGVLEVTYHFKGKPNCSKRTTFTNRTRIICL